jgi:hypothetical protein
MRARQGLKTITVKNNEGLSRPQADSVSPDLVSKKQTFISQIEETNPRKAALRTGENLVFCKKSGKTRSCTAEKILFSAGDFFALRMAPPVGGSPGRRVLEGHW